MPRAVLKVSASAGSRWDPVGCRWQQPGEEIVLDIDDPEEYKRQMFLHSAHCELIEGELPSDPRPSFLKRVKTKAKAAAQSVAKAIKAQDEAKEFKTLSALKTESEEDHSSNAKDSKEGYNCPGCDKTFKTKAVLKKHMKRSGHSSAKPE